MESINPTPRHRSASPVLDWVNTTTPSGLITESRAVVPNIGCYVIEQHREQWFQLSLERQGTEPYVLALTSSVNELKTFAATHAGAMMIAGANE